MYFIITRLIQNGLSTVVCMWSALILEHCDQPLSSISHIVDKAVECMVLPDFKDVVGRYLLHHGGLPGFEDVVCENPGHAHLNGELDLLAHGHLQEELPVPQLRQVTSLLQGLCNQTQELNKYVIFTQCITSTYMIQPMVTCPG